MSMKPLLLTAALLLNASAASAQAPDSCPFKPAELQTTLGVAFQEGRAGQPLSAGTVTMRSCRYEGKGWSLRVNTTAYQKSEDAKKFAMGLAGNKVPIPNDPDGAIFQDGQGDLTDPVVHYARAGTHVELRASGIWYRDSASRQKDMETIRQKLAKLRRVP